MRKTVEWRKHPMHGYMLRGIPYYYGRAGEFYCTVVTALCQNTTEIEESKELWEAHKSRLHVNAGSGAIIADEILEWNVNPEFKIIRVDDVPKHIYTEFSTFL